MDTRPRRARPNLIRRFRADLRGDPRKRVILFGLLPLLVVAWIPVLVSGDEPTPRRGRAAEIAETAVAGSLPSADAGLPIVVDTELRAKLEGLVERLEQPWSPSWRRQGGEDPFGVAGPNVSGHEIPGREAQRRSIFIGEAGGEREIAASLAPTCTFLSTTREDVVIIDGSPYHLGDRIEHFVVEGIGARTVVLRGRFGEYEVHIPLEREGQQGEPPKEPQQAPRKEKPQ